MLSAVVMLLVLAGGPWRTAFGVECNEQVAAQNWVQRCIEGWWCENWDCGGCPECISYCTCDQNVLCQCMYQWWWLTYCWNQDCDGGGIGGLRPASGFFLGTCDTGGGISGDTSRLNAATWRPGGATGRGR